MRDGLPDDGWGPINDPTTWGDEIEFGSDRGRV